LFLVGNIDTSCYFTTVATVLVRLITDWVV
jgi:hypothetical protein